MVWPTSAQHASIVAAGAASILILCVALRARRSRRRWPQDVEVRPSLIAGGGDGLFALRDFESGEVLGEYRGQVLSFMEMLRLETSPDYVMGFGHMNAYVDARHSRDSAARYVNDNFKPGARNARFHMIKSQCFALLLVRDAG